MDEHFSSRLTTRVLLTGFEPFAGAASNPSGDVVRRLVSVPQPELAEAGISLSGVILPVAFRASGSALADAIDAHSPDVVIALGLAEGRSAITPERVAINLDDARIPDNDGDQPLDEPIDPDGPAARFTGLPAKAIVAALTDAGISAHVSLTAGSYVCNHVAYLLAGHAERAASAGRRMRAGFIHVPATPELASALSPAGSASTHSPAGPARPELPTMTLDEIERGIRIAILTAVAVHDDAPLPGGTLH